MPSGGRPNSWRYSEVLVAPPPPTRAAPSRDFTPEVGQDRLARFPASGDYGSVLCPRGRLCSLLCLLETPARDTGPKRTTLSVLPGCCCPCACDLGSAARARLGHRRHPASDPGLWLAWVRSLVAVLWQFKEHRVVVDGGYAKRPFLKASRQQGCKRSSAGCARMRPCGRCRTKPPTRSTRTAADGWEAPARPGQA